MNINTAHAWHKPKGNHKYIPNIKKTLSGYPYIWPILKMVVFGATVFYLQMYIFKNSETIASLFQNIFVSSIVGFAALSLLYTIIHIRRAHNWALRYHELSHHFRNVYAESLSIIQGSDNSKWEDDAVRGLTMFSNEIAEQIAQYFRCFCGTNNIGCCIRLKYSAGTGFATMGRSPELNEPRQGDSRPILADKGLPLAMSKRDFEYAIHIPDIKKAIADDIWERTPNCEQKNIRGVMAMPINIRIKEKKRRMIGILYITSSHHPYRYPFNSCSMELACGFADRLSVYFQGLMGAKDDMIRCYQDIKSAERKVKESLEEAHRKEIQKLNSKIKNLKSAATGKAQNTRTHKNSESRRRSDVTKQQQFST